MDGEKEEIGEAVKPNFINIKVSPEIHTRIRAMILLEKSRGRKVFKNANQLIKFLFQQYDEKIKEKKQLRLGEQNQ